MTQRHSDDIDPLHTILTKLREQLLLLPPSGPDGFEGLVATSLADLTGLTFRLAKSGSQFGRDASTPRGRFAIAMEAKRYADKLRLEDVAGKIWLASNELASDVDAWVLCATGEMGDGVLSKLEQMLEEKGITLLILDWTIAPLPRLAVLLAAARTKVGQWSAAYLDPISSGKIDDALSALEDEEAFAPARDSLRRNASAGFVGLDALAAHNRAWCGKVFSERSESRRAFGQFLTVTDSAHPVISRPALEFELNSALGTAQIASGCVAILGPEGTGKSWLAARCWATAKDKPILIIGGANIAELIDARDPQRTLAKLIAIQQDGDRDENTTRWYRRLQRWSGRETLPSISQLRFILILDGLNERSGMSWAESIYGLSNEIGKLGGCMVITCRERYWEREIAPRLAGVHVKKVKVGDYTPEELDHILQKNGFDFSDLPTVVRSFIRNPRICSVALDLVNRLLAQIDELTIERLLLEYWRRRLEERGDLVAHDIRDFEKLLKSHAKALKNDPKVQFDRDAWREHSGAAQRGDGRSVEHDLSDIEEGAFLRVSGEPEGHYEFKPETVPFALGLLVAHELRDELRKSDRSPIEVIDSILEEVQGFDLVGETLRAAAGIACYIEGYPRVGRAALISVWLGMQNVSHDGYQSLEVYTSVCPEAVLDAVETAFDERNGSLRRKWLISALLARRVRPTVESELTLRLKNWLGRWSRIPREIGFEDETQVERHRKKRDEINHKISLLTPREKTFLQENCFEVDSPEAANLDGVAAFFMAGRPQEECAQAIFAWAFTWSITGDFRRADTNLSWVIRLNRVDFSNLHQEMCNLIDDVLSTDNSRVGRGAAAIALRLLGSVSAWTQAQLLSPRQRGTKMRLVEKYCASDPYDPASSRPSNLHNAVHEANALELDAIWQFVSQTSANLMLEYILPGLARFEPHVLVSRLRTIATSAATRKELALRQLSWHLPQLSPLFDEETLGFVKTGYERLALNPDLIDSHDQKFVAGSILLSLLPHYPANEQLQLYVSLPECAGDWYEFQNTF